MIETKTISLNPNYFNEPPSRVCLVCEKTETENARIVYGDSAWLCDRCRKGLLELIDYINTSNALDCVEKRKNGKWELVDTTKLYEAGLWVDDEIEEKCSLCGCHTFRYETQTKNNFCPNCGADMREDDE